VSFSLHTPIKSSSNLCASYHLSEQILRIMNNCLQEVHSYEVCVTSKKADSSHDMPGQALKGGGVTVPIHSHPGTRRCEWSPLRSGRFTPRNDHVPIEQDVRLTSGPVWATRKISPQPGFDPWTVQPAIPTTLSRLPCVISVHI
jgi:hypothetical protein